MSQPFSPEDWELVKSLFEQASELPRAERDAFVDAQTGATAEVRAEVKRLLRMHSETAAVDKPLLTPGAIESAVKQAELKAGDHLGERFEILNRRGAGGMGVVFEARDNLLNIRIAIKVIRPEIARDARILDRFKKEITLARQVTHPNVCRVYELLEAERSSDGARFTILTMELLEGEPLSAYLRRNAPLTLAAAEPIVRQMAAALEAAHEAGVVHRDFKSGNVLVMARGDEEPKISVTDFGLARSISLCDGSLLSESGLEGGTPVYMAPEQLQNQSAGPATDLYSFGIVMYEMATGKVPFAGESPLQMAVKRVQEKPPAAHTLNPAIDRRWDAVISRCLEIDPDDRYESMQDAMEAMFPPASSWRRWTTWPKGLAFIRVRRRAKRYLKIGLVAAGLLGAGAYVGWQQGLDVWGSAWLDPNAKIWLERGRTATYEMNWAQAELAFNKALEYAPKSTEARARLALAQWEGDRIGVAKGTILMAVDPPRGSRRERELAQAVSSQLRGQTAEALQRFEQLYTKASPGTEALQAGIDYGRALEWAERNDKALPHYSALLKLYPKTAILFLRRGIVQNRTGKNKDALDDFRIAEELFRELSEPEGTGSVLFQIGMMALRSKEAGDVLEIAGRLKALGRPFAPYAARLESRRLAMDGKFKEAEAQLEAAFAARGLSGDEAFVCNSWIALGNIYLSKQEQQLTVEAYSRAADIANKYELVRCAGAALLNLADTNMSLYDPPNYEAALRFSEQAEQTLRNTGLETVLLAVDSTKARILRSAGDPSGAKQSYENVVHRAGKLGDKQREITALSELVKIELFNQNLGPAFALNKRAYDLAQEANLRQLLLPIRRQSLRLLFKKGQLDAAALGLEDLLAAANGLNKPQRIQAYYQLARIRAEQGMREAVEKHLAQIRELVKELGNKPGDVLELDIDSCIDKAAWPPINNVLPLCEKSIESASRNAEFANFRDNIYLAIAHAACQEKQWPLATKYATLAVNWKQSPRLENHLWARLILLKVEFEKNKATQDRNVLTAVTLAHSELRDHWGQEFADGYLTRPFVKPYWDFYRQQEKEGN